MFRDLETIFLNEPELRAYYLECTQDKRAGSIPAYVAPMVANVCMIQASLMQQVFFALRLDRYANATYNRGWMNMFRSWGRSPNFREHFAQLNTTFDPDFLAFYTVSIKDKRPIDAEPVPHHWDT